MYDWDFGPWRVSQFWVTITLVVQTHRQIFQDIALYYNLSFCKILQADFWTDLDDTHNNMVATDDLLALLNKTGNILITFRDFEVTIIDQSQSPWDINLFFFLISAISKWTHLVKSTPVINCKNNRVFHSNFFPWSILHTNSPENISILFYLSYNENCRLSLTR